MGRKQEIGSGHLNSQVLLHWLMNQKGGEADSQGLRAQNNKRVAVR